MIIWPNCQLIQIDDEELTVFFTKTNTEAKSWVVSQGPKLNFT